MSWAGATTVTDLGAMPFYGHDTSLVERENLAEGEGSINYAWLAGISAMMGNAATVALGQNAVIFCEPEWGYEGVGLGSSYPGGSIGSPSGGLTVAW